MESSKAFYLYGVIDHPEIPAIFEDLQMPSPIRCLPIGDFGALMSDVAMEEFGEDALKERLKDPKWLEQHVRHHARVLEAAMRFGTVIPMKFLTIFRTEERLLMRLWELREALRRLCDKLQGKEEWLVKAFCDLRSIRAMAEARVDSAKQFQAQLAGKPSGTAYLMRKQFEKLVRRESDLLLVAHLDAISCRLSAVADETEINPVARELTDRRMVLNAALLVSKASAGGLAAEVGALRQEYLPHGFEFELVGPFPPYDFTELLVCAGEKQAGRPEGAAHE